MIYGMNFISYLAKKYLITLAEKVKKNFKASQAIAIDFFYNDLMTGIVTEKECTKIKYHYLRFCQMNFGFSNASAEAYRVC